MQLPGPVRAAVGLVATAAVEAKRLPDRAIELPMLAVSRGLQASLRVRQRYTKLAARGDAILSRRPTTDEPPAWATFDAPVTASSTSVDAAVGAALDAAGVPPDADVVVDVVVVDETVADITVDVAGGAAAADPALSNPAVSDQALSDAAVPPHTAHSSRFDAATDD